MFTAGLVKERVLTDKSFLPKLALSVLFFLFLTFLAGRFYVVVNKDVYPGVHMVMEFVGIIVAVCSSLMSWYDYKYKHELRMLILCLTFGGVALIEFAHAVSYLGMPAFITPNSVNKASTYWIIFNLLLSSGLVAAIFCGSKVKKVGQVTLLLTSFSLATLVLIVAVALFLPILPPMYNPVAGSQTQIKVILEYVVIFLLLLAAAKLLQKKQVAKQDYYLCLALVLGALSEVAFTFYSNAYDVYNLLGHVFKVFSYAFIFKALSDEAVGMLYETNSKLAEQRELLAHANRQLQEQDRLKDEFLANTNHELRTPLSAIIAFTELLMDPAAGELNDLQKDYLNEINDSGKELLVRINGFLDLSKIAAGKTVVYKEEFLVAELIEDIVRRMAPLFQNKGVVLETIPCPGGIKVLADKDKAGQVLTNLMSNALKFTAPNGIVIVEAGLEEATDSVNISVKDSGIGIDERDLEKIFNPFYQVDGAASRNFGGTGIGLTLAKKLVELNGGNITVSSRRSQGSVFTFTLPVAGREILGEVF
ncbi:Signal transduction histidine-protein kinase BarA [Pelotomaculum schinkii]|uniref:histidine kinase n=1 Tax=Pelotomaculum schinkii TaxID=78350 RepID=A0A4Y7REW9_9FIRM|nr:MASE3 domain-containing protein [Pelotomaculum schinkii]TEB07555.1 Signal transduction histidine-protein kinase BarA [Pelotomaculum schinkii]